MLIQVSMVVIAIYRKKLNFQKIADTSFNVSKFQKQDFLSVVKLSKLFDKQLGKVLALSFFLNGAYACFTLLVRVKNSSMCNLITKKKGKSRHESYFDQDTETCKIFGF